MAANVSKWTRQLDPVCRPLSTIEELESWEPDGHVSCRKRTSRDRQSARPKMLVCHDMMGGYIDSDRYVQGTLTDDGYRFWHWWQLDIFVYFSHELITIPPVCWIDAGHTHSVAILGTFIVEWEAGLKRLQCILQSEDTIKRVANKLVEITEFYGFDGWLLNIECKLQAEEVAMLRIFVKYFSSEMHRRLPNSLVLWYDSVIETGELVWQNELNERNKEFFDECDGIFLNYGWKHDNLESSKNEAQLLNRQFDVYVGVDVFGRGCLGDGGFNTNEAMEVIRQYDLSTALFAPGWVLENKDLLREQFVDNESRFWNLLKDHCLRQPVVQLPFTTTFCRGWGSRYYFNGHTVLDQPWTNMSLQQLQPTSTYCAGDCTVEWTTENAYKGGQCLRLATTTSSGGTVRLFEVDETCIITDDLHVSFTYKKDCSEYPQGAIEGAQVVLVLTFKCASDDGCAESKEFHLVGNDKQTVKTNACVVSSGVSDHYGHHGWTTREYKLTELAANSRLSCVSVGIATEECHKAAILLGELKVSQTCQPNKLTLPETFVGNLSNESSLAANDPAPIDDADASAGTGDESPSAIDLSADLCNASALTADNITILTWTESEELRSLISHYIVYQLQSDEVCGLSKADVRNQTVTAHSDPSEILFAISSKPFLCDLESAATCISCVADESAELSGVSSIKARLEGRWRCIGLTPSSCFRLTTLITNHTNFAVVPITWNHGALSLVRIDRPT